MGGSFTTNSNRHPNKSRIVPIFQLYILRVPTRTLALAVTIDTVKHWAFDKKIIEHRSFIYSLELPFFFFFFFFRLS